MRSTELQQKQYPTHYQKRRRTATRVPCKMFYGSTPHMLGTRDQQRNYTRVRQADVKTFQEITNDLFSPRIRAPSVAKHVCVDTLFNRMMIIHTTCYLSRGEMDMSSKQLSNSNSVSKEKRERKAACNNRMHFFFRGWMNR